MWVGYVGYLYTVVKVAGHHCICAAAHLSYFNSDRAVKFVKSARPVGYRGYRDGVLWVGYFHYLHAVIQYAGHRRIRPAIQLDYCNVSGAIQHLESARPVGYSCHRDGGVRVGYVGYLHALVQRADGHSICAAIYIGYCNVSGAIQHLESARPVGYSCYRDGVLWVGYFHYLHAVIQQAGHHRICAAIQLGYLYIHHTVQLVESANTVGYCRYRDRCWGMRQVDHLYTVIGKTTGHRVRPVGYLNRLYVPCPIKLSKPTSIVGDGRYRNGGSRLLIRRHKFYHIIKHAQVRPMPSNHHVDSGPDHHPAVPFRVIVNHDSWHVVHRIVNPVRE